MGPHSALDSHEFGRRAQGGLVAHLRALAATCATDAALIVPVGDAEKRISHAELDLRVRAQAAELQARYEPGDRVLLLLDNDDRFVVGFLACLYAGLVAVPAFPPQSLRDHHMARLRSIARDARPCCVLINGDDAALAESASEIAAGLQCIAVDAVSPDAASRWQQRAHDAREVVFLQYTSGSTAAPKGVIVDHGNLLANEYTVERAMQTGDDDVFVSWLPLFHDMGLVGGLCQPLYRGIPLVLTSPAFFLERPARWLQLITRHRGTMSGGPDFAYRLCAERVTESQMKSLDLSSWRVAFCGAEPVRHDTLRAFAKRFESVGFDARALYPCYGLAEATLFVTGGLRGEGMTEGVFSKEGLAGGRAVRSERGTTLVGCGRSQLAHGVQIADPRSEEQRADGEVGEILVSGPSVSRGYWQCPEATARTFVERNGQRWLRTGDLGFVDRGQLYVTGRLKDMIILRGRNIYPQDVERAIESEIEAVRKGRVAAFAVQLEFGEGVGVALEVSRSLQKLIPPERLIDELNEVVGRLCHEPVAVAVLLNPGGLPKTSSGKVRRSACSTGWLQKSLDAYAIHQRGKAATSVVGSADAAATLTETQRKIGVIWSDVLGLRESIGVGASFFSLGGNSITAAQVIARVEREFAVRVTLDTLLSKPSLTEFCTSIESERDAQAKAPVAQMTPVSGDQPLLLSPAQQRMWFLWQLEPASAAYHIGGGLRLRGPLAESSVQRALNELQQRHELLRTAFRQGDGTVMLNVLPDSGVALEVVDLQRFALEERMERADALSAEELKRPFDLGIGPPIRATLLKLGSLDHLLLVTVHHIAADGASMELLVEDFVRLYTGADLARSSFRYVDYARWQSDRLAAGEGERQLEYWKARLGGAYPDVLPHPDRLRSLQPGTAGMRVSVPIDQPLANDLHAYAKAEGVTLFMVLLAAWKIVLARHSGHMDVRVGAPVANRRSVESQSLVGPLLNTVVLRTSVEGDLSARQFLQRVRRTVVEAHANQDVPFERLVEALETNRARSRHPLFQVLHNHQQRRRTVFTEPASLSVEAFERHGDVTRFDLALNTEKQGGSLSAAITYSTALYDASTITRLGSHWLNVLRALATAPESRIDSIKLPGERELMQLVSGFNNTARAYQDDVLVHQWFERHAARMPDAEAVVFESSRCSYRELNRRANRLASELRGQGVGPDVLVGICSERSVELVVGLLAIMKAGGACLPLDPTYPSERLAFILEDARPRVLLAEDRVLELLPVQARQKVWPLDREPASNSRDDSNVPAAPHQHNLAYCLYTSGSTGQPKCVGNTHAALLNQLLWRQEVYGLDATDRVLQKTPIGFDVSMWEVFWPLLAGGTIVVAPAGAHKDPWRLREIIERNGVTTAHFVPPMLDAFLEAHELRRCRSLRRVFVGGQALSVATQATFFRECAAELHNLYGPTEAAIDVSCWVCAADAGESAVPIGRPIANTQLYVLDAGLEPAPIGVVGELFIGGTALARGYLDRPSLTAKQFVPNPFTPGERMYRTGDFARFRPDGVLEYIGRIDHQVKVRGFRIELGEIEARLREHCWVQDAAVAVGRDRLGGSELIACVVCSRAALDSASDPAEWKDELHRHLARHLPPYMLPVHYAWLDALPLLPNGKLDRATLPVHDVAPAGRQYVPPRDEIEQRIASIWSQVLNVAAVGADDNFFELGGHSLLATNALSRIRRGFDIDLPLRALFEANDLGELANAVRCYIAACSRSVHGEITGVDRTQPLESSRSPRWLPNPHADMGDRDSRIYPGRDSRWQRRDSRAQRRRRPSCRRHPSQWSVFAALSACHAPEPKPETGRGSSPEHRAQPIAWPALL